MTGSWRPAFRIARRTIRRSVGRSVLIAVLVAVPVAGATAVDIIYRTTSGDEHQADQKLGHADAAIMVTNQQQLPDDTPPTFDEVPSGDVPRRDPSQVDVRELLPPGSRVVPDAGRAFNVVVEHAEYRLPTATLITTFDDPLTAHQVGLKTGRWPRAADEILISAGMAERLDLLDDDGNVPAGTSFTVQEGPTVTVTGVAVEPYQISSEVLFTAPGSALARHAEQTGKVDGNLFAGLPVYLADLPESVDVDNIRARLLDRGVLLMPRAAIADPERYAPADETAATAVDLQAVGLVTLVLSLGALEVVLLAGAAFAVGARRQTRELGLLTAAGASAKQLRHVVLAQGAILGVLGAALGVLIGGLAAIAGRPVWQSLHDMRIDTWRFEPLDVLAAASLGALSGLAAAIMPAIAAARMKPVDALTARFRAGRIAARMPAAGLALAAVGAVGALVTSRIAADELTEYSARLAAGENAYSYIEPPSTGPYLAIQVVGAILAIAGLVIMVPGLVSLLARFARRLPLSARLALRDAARHRHRTAPTIAAITVVVAGTVGAVTGAHGIDRLEQLQHQPFLPPNTIAVETDEDNPGTAPSALPSEITEIANRHLPSADVWSGRHPARDDPPRHELWVGACTDCGANYSVPTRRLWLGDDDGVAIATAAGANETEIRAALDRDEIVVFDDRLVHNGRVRILEYNEFGDYVAARSWHPAKVVHQETQYIELPGALISPAAAELNLSAAPISVIVVRDDNATPQQLDAARLEMESTGAFVTVETGQPPAYSAAIIGFVAIAALVTLMGVTVSVALAAAEGRADLATLAAVGAPARRRRILAGCQALVVGGIGVTLGTALGLYFAYMLWPAIGPPAFTAPWPSLAVIGLAVPLLAVVVAMICTPSRLPMIRRLE